MSITDLGVDILSNEMYGLPSALNYYYYNNNIPNRGVNDSDFLTICPAIQSIQYVPFIDYSDLDLYKIPYDLERFGEGKVIDVHGCHVYRIGDITNTVKKLGSFKCYKPNKNIGGKVHYKNESRLYNYPFSFAMLTDHLGNTMEIKYHLCKTNDCEVNVINTISNSCSYGIYVKGYKGDDNGSMESIVSNSSHELPCSSSAYNQWYSSSRNQVEQNTLNIAQNSFLTKQTNRIDTMNNVLGSLGSIGSIIQNPFNLIGINANIIGSLNNGMYNYKKADNDLQQAIKNNLAQTKDMISTPNTMLSMGSNIYYGLNKGNRKVQLIRFSLQPKQLEKIGNYFTMFGYKQNKVTTPNIRNRHYFNYIKTVGCNLSTNSIPRSHLEELKSIFDRGTTIWHVDREGVIVGDYSNDNYEV